MSQVNTVLNYLRSGKTLNEGQARGLFGIQSLSKVVSNLRDTGHCVYTTQNKTTGTTAYRIGKPSPKMVSAAYYLMGSELFSVNK